MKSSKKHPTSAASKKPAPDLGLSPRQIALQKRYRFLIMGGILPFVLTLIVLGVEYGDRLLPGSQLAWAHNKGRTMRDPILNPGQPPGPAPPGMVWVPGGEFYMGIDDDEVEDANEVHLVFIDGLWMDQHEVTNEAFARFVAATGYLTIAEKIPVPKEFPEVPVNDLKPFSIVFQKPGPGDIINLALHQGWWKIRYGACWKHPEGPGSTILGREKHPVVHISYPDALAFCKWSKKRLPTEAEWEFAARGGLDRKLYPWGDEIKPGGKWMANIWQGNFPYVNTREDGYEGTAPVGSFAANGYGLYDMAGNAWEWCADWYQPSYYRESPEKNPPGPSTGYDPLEPNTPKRVQRGGSFLCANNYCVRYQVGTRGKGEVHSAACNTGFRCVQDRD